MDYQAALERESYGPDVMMDTTDFALRGSPFKIPAGDANRLRKRASEWWNDMHGKRAWQYRNKSLDSRPAAATADSFISYERRYAEGGQMQFFANPPKPMGDGLGAEEGDQSGDLIVYQNEQGEWTPIPIGFVPGTPLGTPPGSPRP